MQHDAGSYYGIPQKISTHTLECDRMQYGVMPSDTIQFSMTSNVKYIYIYTYVYILYTYVDIICYVYI